MKREFIRGNDKKDIKSTNDLVNAKINQLCFDNDVFNPEPAMPASTGIQQDGSGINADKDLARRVLKIKNSSEYKDFNSISLDDGSIESLTLSEIPDDDIPIEENAAKRKHSPGMNCFKNDDTDTRIKKTKAMESFYKDKEQMDKVTAMLCGIFHELFEEMNIDEKPEDEIQDAAESFLTKRPWDVDKYPDYMKQLIYVFKFNVIPNLLNKYFGKRKKNLSDDEIQLRNYMGKGLRDAPRERNVFRKEAIPEFELDADNGKVIYYFEEKETDMRIDRASYETLKESLERERRSKVAREMILMADQAILKKGDDEIDVLWEIIKNAEDYGKIDLLAAKKMNKTPNEIRTIKRRLTRYLRKHVNIDISNHLKEEYEEKLAMSNFKH